MDPERIRPPEVAELLVDEEAAEFRVPTGRVPTDGAN
jgi:hypothetical protein